MIKSRTRHIITATILIIKISVEICFRVNIIQCLKFLATEVPVNYIVHLKGKIEEKVTISELKLNMSLLFTIP